MPSNARCVEPGLAYHVLRQHCVDAEVRVLAYCLMSNHVHLVVVPGRADSLAVLFRRVHGRYAQYLNIRRQRSGHLWQSRFFSCALSESHLWVALRYVEQNPCRACIAGTPGEYRWSSAGAHLRERLRHQRPFFADGPETRLLVARVAELADHQYLQGTPEAGADLLADDHTSSRNAEDDRLRVAHVLQRVRQAAASLATIGEALRGFHPGSAPVVA